MHTPNWLKALAGAFVVLVLASACSSESTSDNSNRDDSGNIIEGGDVGVFALEIGDCFNQPPDGNISEVAAVPCADPHDSEVFATFDINGGDNAPYPGDAEVRTKSEKCTRDLFSAYVGIDYASSRFGVLPITPTQETWESNLHDREVICTANTVDGTQITASIQDTGE